MRSFNLITKDDDPSPDSSVISKVGAELKDGRSDNSPLTKYDITIQMGEITESREFIDEMLKLHVEVMKYMCQMMIRLEA